MNVLKSGRMYDVMSQRLVTVLEDIGVTELIVGRRRHTFLQDESVRSVSDKLRGLNVVHYHFGSMTEGTTTPGMGSDIDTLECDDDVNIMHRWSDWELGKDNLLMVKHETCSPQHYRLQEARRDLPLPLTQPYDEFCVIDGDGKIYRSNTCWEECSRQFYADNNLPCYSAGPSRSFTEMLDFVYANRCKQLPSECDSWFTRPRHRNWPTTEMLQTARELGCFLLPDGHCDSKYSSLEWRVSPSLIERHLMFSMEMIHVHCYVTLKLVKKDIINPYLNQSGKITSFHCKTALFYAREQLDPSMWTADNLFKCVIHCLKLLRLWTRSGHCPHYIMDTVNLFDGKINRKQRKNLYKILTDIIDTHLAPLVSIQTDNLGVRLLHNVYTVAIWDMTPRTTVCQGITGFLSVFCSVTLPKIILDISEETSVYTSDALFMYLHSLIIKLPIQQPHRHQSEETLSQHDIISRDIITRHLFQHLASVAASICLQQGISIGQRIWTWYGIAINTDVASTKLKIASMLYCKGDLQLAADVLEDVERRYDNTVQAMCGCGMMNPLIHKPQLAFANGLNENETDVLALDSVAYCVRFLRQEAFCVPLVLHYEMSRAVGNDLHHRGIHERKWMDWAVVDSLPFLHYLRYLTFRGLGHRHRQLQGLQSLEDCIFAGLQQQQLFHPETATNLLAHCWEMENRPDVALLYFYQSQANVPRNNAANWHIRRLTGD